MDVIMREKKPAIVPTTQNRFFWAGALEGRLLVQRCDDCGRYRHPPMPLCASCHSRNAHPGQVSGHGRIFSYTVVRRVFHPGFVAEVPYVVAMVELEEQANLYLVSRIVGCEPEAVGVGNAVDVAFEPYGDWALPVFRLLGAPVDGVAR
jgi:uncharacterized OB-fold protein